MISNRKLKKGILILTGIIFIGYPAFDRYIALNKEPSMIMYVTALVIGLGYLVYGLKYQ